jgi:hypothetical protein
MLAKAAMAATIAVHAPDAQGRVFVDVVGQINDDDFKTFKEKTDQIYPIGSDYPNKQVIVTLISPGGHVKAGLLIGDQIRKRGMSTFVPAGRTCASACALIWLAGRSRNVGDTSLIGFHAVYDSKTRQEKGTANAIVGAYLRDLGLGYDAIIFMTRAAPTSVEWLTLDRAKEFKVGWAMLQPPRATPIPPQPKLPPGVRLVPPAHSPWTAPVPSALSKPGPAPQPAAQQPFRQPAEAPAASPKPVCLTPAGTPEPCEARVPQQSLQQPAQAPQPTLRRYAQPPVVMLAQKAVLYEERPTPSSTCAESYTPGCRSFGWVIWGTESVTPGPGQPPEVVIRADVEVPDRKLVMTWSLRRNTDKGLPATHVVEITFNLAPGFPHGGISNIPAILMRPAEQTRGMALTARALKVTNDFFLIGLSNAETAKDHNLQLLKERSWLDIPLVYNDNARAILTVEKGAPGERVFADAFKVWDQYAPVPQRASPKAEQPKGTVPLSPHRCLHEDIPIPCEAPMTSATPKATAADSKKLE